MFRSLWGVPFFLLGAFVGWLNFQIEHHLFPDVCHVHYPAIARIVEATCRESGIPYHSAPTLHAAVASHYRFLRALGKPGPSTARTERTRSAERASAGRGGLSRFRRRDGERSYCSSSASRRAWYGVPSASIASAAACFAAWALGPMPSGSFTEVPFGRWQMHVQPPGPEWSSTRGSENACAALVPSRLRAHPSRVLHQEITLYGIPSGRGRHPIFAGRRFGQAPGVARCYEETNSGVSRRSSTAP